MTLVWVAAPIAAAIHVLIFAMESLWWRRPAVQQRFRATPAQAEASRLFAFNQGFYNLFLAIGVGGGLWLLAGDHRTAGLILVCWNTASMLAASVVLLASAPKMWRGALIQGLPASIALFGALLA